MYVVVSIYLFIFFSEKNRMKSPILLVKASHGWNDIENVVKSRNATRTSLTVRSVRGKRYENSQVPKISALTNNRNTTEPKKESQDQQNQKAIKMTKSDVSYASLPTSAPSTVDPKTHPDATAEPYVEGFVVGSSHAVTVIVDENTNSAYAPKQMERGASLLSYSRRPVELKKCPNCHASHVRTSTRTYPSAITWVGVVVSACIFVPLCWIPLVVDPMKQTDHYCQSCGKKVGTIKALDGCFVKERL